MVISSIDLRAMAALVQSMTTAAKTLEDSARSMKSTSEHVFGSASETQKISATAGWVRDQIPGLRRRLALAQQIEAQARGFQPTVQIDETRLSSVPPDVAIAQGAAAAKKVKESGADLDPALIAQIAENQSDPYFAAGFA
jgi:anti-sigma factor ChrR (cupin superfamily)